MSVLERARTTLTGAGTAIATRGLDAATKVNQRLEGTPVGEVAQQAASKATNAAMTALGVGASVLQRVRRRTEGAVQEAQPPLRSHAPLQDAATVVPTPATPPVVEPAALVDEATLAGTSAPPSAEELPIEDFDHLTIGSLRARLARLDALELATLIDYERAHAARANVLTMLENRINKVRAAG